MDFGKRIDGEYIMGDEDMKKLKIELKRLEEIASYYQFPLAVFLGGKIPKGIRKNNLLRRVRELKGKLINIIDETL